MGPVPTAPYITGCPQLEGDGGLPFLEAVALELPTWRQQPQRGTKDVTEKILKIMTVARVEANVFHYNAALSAYGDSAWDSAQRLLSQMSVNGIAADEFSFSAIFSSQDHWQRAFTLWRGMAVPPNTVCHLEEWQQALQLQLKDPGPVVTNTLCAAYQLAQVWQCSIQLLSQSATARLLPSLRRHSAVLRALGSWRKALALWEEMGGRLPFRPNDAGFQQEITCSSAAYACAQDGGWEDAAALLVAAGMATVRPNEISRSMLTIACEQASQWLQAICHLDVESDADVAPASIGAVPRAIGAVGSARKWRLALFLRAPGPSCDAAALSSCASAGRWELALQLAGSGASGPAGLHAALRAIAKGRRWPVAVELLKAFGRLRVQPSVVSYDVTLGAFDTVSAWSSALMLLLAESSDSLGRFTEGNGAAEVLLSRLVRGVAVTLGRPGEPPKRFIFFPGPLQLAVDVSYDAKACGGGIVCRHNAW
eukprot:s86_g16.t1